MNEETEAPEPSEPGTPNQRSGFSWAIVNFWLDVAIAVVFLALAWISAVLRFLFPVGLAALETTLWGWNETDWRDVQFVVLCVFAVGVLVHVMLHWSWICGVVARRLLGRRSVPDSGMQTLYGVITLAIVLHVLGVAFVAAMFGITLPN